MKGLFVIYRKEVISFFRSPLFYMMAFLMTILLSVSFTLGLQNFSLLLGNALYQYAAQPQQLNAHYALFIQHLSFVNMIFIFFTPALAMKLLSEEKKQKSFALLMTSPVGSNQIVAGKFFSLVTVLLVLELIAFIYIVAASSLIEFTWGPTILTALGIFFIGVIYASISLFAASLTENTMISFILGVVLNLGLWIIGGLSEFLENPKLKILLEQASVNQHLQLLADGVVKTNSIVFFITLPFLFCFLAERTIESSRWRTS